MEKKNVRSFLKIISNSFLLVALILVLFSSYISLSKITGFSVLQGIPSNYLPNSFLLILSFVLILIAFYLRKKE